MYMGKREFSKIPERERQERDHGVMLNDRESNMYKLEGGIFMTLQVMTRMCRRSSLNVYFEKMSKKNRIQTREIPMTF